LDYEAQNTLVQKRDRVPTITVSADVPTGVTAAAVQKEINETIEAIALPLGYQMEWGGEYEN